MSDKLIAIAVFTNEVEAEVARSLLDSRGIPAAVMSDDAGGMIPSLQQTTGVRLMVSEEDADNARDILEEEYGDEDEEPGD